MSTGTGVVARRSDASSRRSTTPWISSGCRLSRSSMWPVAESTGSTAFITCARRARACSRSSSSATARLTRKSPGRLRNRSLSSSRMRKISSASSSSAATMSLLISTDAIGSRNRLAPLAEEPCTMPGMAALCSARTISTYRPWRLVTTCSCRYFAVSRPLANCSSVVRSFARCRRSRSRIDASLGLASSSTSPFTSMARRTAATSSAKGARRPTRRCRIGYEPGRAGDGRLRVGNRRHEVGQDAQLQRLERTALDRQRRQRRVEPGARAQREDAVLLDVAHRLARGGERLRHDGAIRLRLLAAHARLAHGREREAGERLDDAVELERAEEGGGHGGSRGSGARARACQGHAIRRHVLHVASENVGLSRAA